MAINRAESQYITKNFSEFAEVNNAASKCIFLSHKTEDKAIAIKIGEYILKAGIDIYLDIRDSGLQGAVERNDDTNIVKYIEKGIQTSTHIMCIISEKTQISWWVPYEIGYAKKAFKGISSLKLKTVSSLPSFLKIEKQIINIKVLNEYLKELNNVALTESYISSSNSLSNYMELF